MSFSVGILLAAALASQSLGDLEVTDSAETTIRLVDGNSRATVIVFLGCDCPLANLYAPRLKELAARSPEVRFIALSSNDHDAPADREAFVRKHGLGFPFLQDAEGRVTERLGATRSPEAFVLDRACRVRYRGRIDDQYTAGGKNRQLPSRPDLAEALREVLDNRPVSVPVTVASGCLIGRPSHPVQQPAVTFREVAPIVNSHCQPCHSPGEIGPFPLTTFAEVRGHAHTIAEVIEEGRMPPWHASPLFGRFRNDRRLSDRQKELILNWVKLGCPEGAPSASALPAASEGWMMGKPDAVFAIPAAFTVPAEGAIEYQHFIVDPGFSRDVWMAAGEVRPGNRRVVHHCSVFLQPPTANDPEDFFETGALGSHNLVAFTPGSGPVVFPTGMAKRIPAGWRLHFVVHYTPIGAPAVDRTELGIRFLDPGSLHKEVATRLLNDPDLAIPPHAAAHPVEMAWTADRDYLLLSMLPHMHLRGKSFRYTAEYPDGTTEILLDVADYDFNWQHRYELLEPKRIPAGTVLRCRAIYNNSAGNPANPNPNVTVRTGPQSWDEMFNGYFDIVLADQDLASERQSTQSRRLWSAIALIAASMALVAWSIRIRRRTEPQAQESGIRVQSSQPCV
jgi:hypothetical protein